MIVAHGLGVRYARHRWGLADFTCRVAGSAVGVLGPNGAGKSTLLSLVTGAREATTGQLSVAGLDLSERRERRTLQSRLGFVPQSVDIYPGYSVEQFLRYVCWLRRVAASEVPGRIDAALRATDLWRQRDDRIRTLSGGTRQRVALAQTLVNEPDLIVLDEPTVGLDPEQRAQFLNRVRALTSRTRVVLATHLVEDVAEVCDAVVVLYEGRSVFTGSVRELVAEAGADTVTGPSVGAGYLAVLDRVRVGTPS
ncbi:MAG: yxlF 4 [Mycobacterium sp.]|nr:yxlF 4 [Mycobacterium sp.]